MAVAVGRKIKLIANEIRKGSSIGQFFRLKKNEFKPHPPPPDKNTLNNFIF